MRAADENEKASRRRALEMTEADCLSEGICPDCRGDGLIGRNECGRCNGTGERAVCEECGETEIDVTQTMCSACVEARVTEAGHAAQ